MDRAATGQVEGDAAEVYERFFVPALFAEWAPVVAGAASVAAEERVLDIACGTGVLAREIARRVGPQGYAVGLDLNERMLAVARREAPEIEWRHGQAEDLPFDDGAFDAVVSQFGLMFFEDRARALREAWRVLRPGGRLAVAVWGSLDRSPGYAAMTALLDRLFGERVADALRAPFVLGDVEVFRATLAGGGVADPDIRTRVGTARFPSIEAWVHVDVRGWTLSELIDDARYEALQREADVALKPYVQADGTVAFDIPAYIATATKQ